MLTVNTLAPVRVTEALLPNLLAGNTKLVVAITSKMGSIADNSSGGSLLYRSSKAGLNAGMKSLSMDLADHQIGVLILHPGWVQTDMGGSHALITAEQSVTGMSKLINDFKIADSGQFLGLFRSTDCLVMCSRRLSENREPTAEKRILANFSD